MGNRSVQLCIDSKKKISGRDQIPVSKVISMKCNTALHIMLDFSLREDYTLCGSFYKIKEER